MSFYIHTDAYIDVHVGMGIGILIPEAMISKPTIDKLASVDDRDPHEMPKLIILDMKLPTLNGLEVLQRIRSDPRTQRLPVVSLVLLMRKKT